MMRTLSLLITRFLLSAWVGAAVLFVVTSVSEQRSRDFDSQTKTMLAVIRFPSYYLFAFTMLGVALFCGLLAWGHRDFRGRKAGVAVALLTGALALVSIDYLAIYQPLEAMMLDQQALVEPTFSNLHNVSKWINLADLLLVFLASILACHPTVDKTSTLS